MNSSPAPRPRATWVLPDKMGGMTNIVANLLAHRQPDDLLHEVVWTRVEEDPDTPHETPLAADREVTVTHRMPRENLHAALRRLGRAIPVGPGALVTSDWIELALAWVDDRERAVVQVLHGDHDWYYDLATRNEPVIDAFVVYSRAMERRLIELLPHRGDAVHHLPYGIPLPATVRRPAPPGTPLRLLFAGRLEHGQKGVFDLPEIDRRLAAAEVPVTWTVIGGGPDEDALRRRWDAPPERVAWAGVLDNATTVGRMADHDVFVLPTRAEGFPVALVEAMGAGLVPVVSAIESGVPELVDDGASGALAPVGDIEAYAAAIAGLAAERPRLEAWSRAARARIEAHHRIEDRVGAWQDLLARHRELRPPRRPRRRPPYGSRLDRPWLPNPLVRLLRALRGPAAGSPRTSRGATP